MVSSLSLDSLKSDQWSTDSGELLRSRSQSDNLSEDEEFRPSSEMIKIWQAMERRVTRPERPREALKTSRTANVGLSHPTKTLTRSCDPETGGGADLGSVTEEDSSSGPSSRTGVPGLSRTGSLKNALKVGLHN